MEREIKFRGKNTKSGKWIYGHYVVFSKADPSEIPCVIDEGENYRVRINSIKIDTHYIVVDGLNPFPVDPDTIGQYTGENDVNNKPAYDGDLVLVTIAYTPTIYQIVYVKGAFCLADKDGNVQYGLNDVKFVIIGNRFDTPEILEDLV